MLEQFEIRSVLNRSMLIGQEYHIQEIYALIPSSLLDSEDFDPPASGHTEPKWQRNVRNTLQRGKRKGEVRNPSRGRYIRIKNLQ